jgi:hypothetical protein
MATFNNIINKVVNLDNNIFSLNYDTNDNIPGIYKIFFNMLSNIKLNKQYKNKFQFIEETLNNFYFSVKPIEKNEFFNLFCKIQHIYHTLNRFVFLYKFKKSNLSVDTDLQLNKINQNEPNVICIYHINSKYLFKIEELLKHIYVSLTNSFTFFSEPIAIRNPYNNLPFGKSILYFIHSYFAINTNIKFINIKYIDVFLKFKDSNFNLTNFLNNHEHILREYTIQNFINNSTKHTIVNEIKKMITSYNNNFLQEIDKILISEEFPEDVLIRIMKPYLYLRLQAKYSLIIKNQIIANKKLSQKLREFQCFNPQFGKKIIKFKDIVKNGKIKKVKSHIEFIMKHKKFNTYEIDSFMSNHLSYKYDNYEYEENNQDSELVITHVLINTQINEQGETNYEEDEDTQEYQEDEDTQEYEEDDLQEEQYDNDSIS